MKYSVYVQQNGQSEQFLQSSDYLERVKKDKATVDRWLYEMGITITSHKSAVFNIYADGELIFKRPLLGEGSRSWIKVKKSTDLHFSKSVL